MWKLNFVAFVSRVSTIVTLVFPVNTNPLAAAPLALTWIVDPDARGLPITSATLYAMTVSIPDRKLKLLAKPPLTIDWPVYNAVSLTVYWPLLPIAANVTIATSWAGIGCAPYHVTFANPFASVTAEPWITPALVVK